MYSRFCIIYLRVIKRLTLFSNRQKVLNSFDVKFFSTMIRVAVIGAGVAGLTASRRLSEQPNVFEYVTFESASSIGGTWIYTDKALNELSTFEHRAPCPWKTLQLNTPEVISTIPGFEYPSDTPNFKTVKQVQEYLDNFAKRFDLLTKVRLNTNVEKVLPIKDRHGNIERWEVTTRDVKSGCVEIENFDAVMDCSGRYNEPKPIINFGRHRAFMSQ